MTLSSAPSRGAAPKLFCVIAAFAAGPALGTLVARWIAPDSELAELVSPLAFALAFVGGLLLWAGIGFSSVAFSRLRGRRPRLSSDRQPLPPGYGAFLPLALGFGLLAGVVVGLVPQSISFGLSCAAHLAAGAAYGLSLRALARNGYIPFEPDG